MGSINRVTIMGIIGSQPELKKSSGGKSYVNLSVATHRRFKDPGGHTQRETQWHKVMVWGKNAELITTYCDKGAPIYVEGHLAQYVREENGVRRTQINIVGDQIQFIPGSKTALSADRGEFEPISNLQTIDEPTEIDGSHQVPHENLATLN